MGFYGVVQVFFGQRIIQKPAFKSRRRKIYAALQHGMEVFFKQYVVGRGASGKISHGVNC
jgi:hypothetical protein